MRSRRSLAAIPLFALLCLTLADCGDPDLAAPGAPPHIASIVPDTTQAGVPFNKQPNGDAALSVNGEAFAEGAVVTANGAKLPTTFGNAGWVTAVMPAAMYAQPGIIAIQVSNPNGATSNAVDFNVKP
ncbi:MAG: hypothetical protein R2762_13480 [Bryobacteraceae bacterium]